MIKKISFEITSVSRDDLESIGFNTQDVDDETMQELASKMAEAYCNDGFWMDLPILAEHLEIPKRCINEGCNGLQTEDREYCDKCFEKKDKGITDNEISRSFKKLEIKHE